MKKYGAYYPWVVCSFGAIFYCYEYILRIFPSVIAEQLSHYFFIGAAGFGQLAAFYYYAYDPMQLPVGLLVDRYGPRKLLASAALVCAVGSAVFIYPYFVVASFGRFLVGFGSAFAF